MSDWRSSNKRLMDNVRAGNPNRALIIAARIALTRPDFPNQNVNGPRPIVRSFPWKRPVLPSARGQFLDDGASGNYPPDSLISTIIGKDPGEQKKGASPLPNATPVSRSAWDCLLHNRVIHPRAMEAT